MLSNPWLTSSAGSSVGGINLDSEEIANGILILKPREPTKGLRAARSRILRSNPVEMSFQQPDDVIVRCLVRPSSITGRHLTGVELANDLLPRLEVICHRLLDDRLQIQFRFRIVSLVTIDTKVGHKCLNRRCRSRAR